MNKFNRWSGILLPCCFIALNTFAAEPEYKADVPASLLTPDTVQARYAGELTFRDGFPTEDTQDVPHELKVL